MEVEILRPSVMPAELIERWRGLQEADVGLDSPFLSPEWAAVVERAQGRADAGVRVAVWRQAGRACGFLASRAGSFTAMEPGAPLCDYQGIVSEPGLALDPRAMVRALGVGRFDFSHMLADQTAFQPYGHGRDASWIVDVSDGYAAYADSRRQAGGAALRDLGKKRRKAEREAGGVVFTAQSRREADFERLFVWKRGQLRATGQIDLFAAAWPLRLMRDLFAAGGEAGFGGTLFTLHIGGALAAAHFHLRGRRTLHAWMIAHSTDFERYSPGMLLFQDILRWMDGTPFQRLDLGHGDYRFKRELANAHRQVCHGFVGVPSPSAMVRGAAYGVRRAAETLPLGGVSGLPGKAMRRLDVLRGLR